MCKLTSYEKEPGLYHDKKCVSVPERSWLGEVDTYTCSIMGV